MEGEADDEEEQPLDQPQEPPRSDDQPPQPMDDDQDRLGPEGEEESHNEQPDVPPDQPMTIPDPQSPRRPRDDNEERPHTKQQRSSKRSTARGSNDDASPTKARRVAMITLPGKQRVSVEVSEEPQLPEPFLPPDSEYPAEKLREAMDKEMKAMRDFNVYTEVDANTVNTQPIKTRWVLRWKSDHELKARLVAKGYTEQVSDLDNTYASTPIFVTLRVLLVLALPLRLSIQCCDISTAFLHALVQGDVYVQPPQEYYQDGRTSDTREGYVRFTH